MCHLHREPPPAPSFHMPKCFSHVTSGAEFPPPKSGLATLSRGHAGPPRAGHKKPRLFAWVSWDAYAQNVPALTCYPAVRSQSPCRGHVRSAQQSLACGPTTLDGPLRDPFDGLCSRHCACTHTYKHTCQHTVTGTACLTPS